MYSNVTLVSFSHSANAFSSMRVTLPSKWTDSISLLSMNASSPMTVMCSGTTTFLSVPVYFTSFSPSVTKSDCSSSSTTSVGSVSSTAGSVSSTAGSDFSTTTGSASSSTGSAAGSSGSEGSSITTGSSLMMFSSSTISGTDSSCVSSSTFSTISTSTASVFTSSSDKPTGAAVNIIITARYAAIVLFIALSPFLSESSQQYVHV